MFENYVKLINKPNVWDMANLEIILKAYDKDPKSIEGICKKILK